jgi:hypothetical protein
MGPKCHEEGRCEKMRREGAINDALADRRVGPSRRTKDALAFMMAAVLMGVCPACGRPIR